MAVGDDDDRSGTTRTTAVVAGVLVAAVTVLCLLTSSSTAGATALLLIVPIAVAADRGGRRLGLVGAALALGLFTLWAVARGVDVGAVGVVAQAVAYVVVAVFVGRRADDAEHTAATGDRWFEMSNDLLVEADLDGYFSRVSRRWEQALGWDRHELTSRPFRDFIHPDDLSRTMDVARALEEHPGEVVNFENRYRAKDGTWRWLLWSAQSDEHRKYAVARDITERKQLEQQREVLLEELEVLAMTDALTGLPNRRRWDVALLEALDWAESCGGPLTVAIADLDLFKAYNDAFGHAAGDDLLVEAARRWRMVLRATDVLARYGGEEFALLLPGCTPEHAVGLLERLRAATPEGQTCSLGVAGWRPGDGSDAIVGRADAALYQAKREGRDRSVTAA